MDHRISARPPSIVRDARQLRTRERLHAALLRLLDTRSFDKVTLREITHEAGIGYATFFRHYPSKEALLSAVAGAEIAALLARALPVLEAEDTARSCEELLRFVAEHRTLWATLLTGGAAGPLKDEFLRQASLVASEHDIDGSWLPSDLRVRFAVGATVDLLAWWLDRDTPMPIAQMSRILDHLVIRPAVHLD